MNEIYPPRLDRVGQHLNRSIFSYSPVHVLPVEVPVVVGPEFPERSVAKGSQFVKNSKQLLRGSQLRLKS